MDMKRELANVKVSGPKVDFGPRPHSYVAGAGRGAVGFTTRSDIGPSRQAVVPVDRSISAQKDRQRQAMAQLGAAPSGYVAGAGRGASSIPGAEKTVGEEDLSESQFDAFNGYGGALFGNSAYDEEDQEADRVFRAIDERMDSKRKIRRLALEKKMLNEYHRKRPRMSELFQKEKADLASLSTDEWANIPAPISFSERAMSKKKHKRGEQYTPVPDQIIENARRGGSVIDGASTAISGLATSVEGWQTQHAGGLMTQLPTTGVKTDLTQLGKARDKFLQYQLDKMSDSISGQTVVDPKGYLTDMTSQQITSESDVSDVLKARTLLKSVVTTNPKHPPGWIAAARLEEAAGKMAAARKLIIRGTEECPTSPDIWMEAGRLHGLKHAKAILAKAVKHVPNHPDIWMKAAILEGSNIKKKRVVLRRALEFIPDSVKLWKAAVELENQVDARLLLSRAVECVPKSTEMWLALARLETYQQAKVVINKARTKIPTDPSIWIAAAKLEEDHKNKIKISKIIQKCVKSMDSLKVVIDRDDWLKEAGDCEKSGHPDTCRAIVKATIAIGVEDEDRREAWTQDAASWLRKGYIVVARSIYVHMLETFPNKWKIWWNAAKLERQHGKPKDLFDLLEAAITHCPAAVNLWLLYAKEKWNLEDDVDGARKLLQRAQEANPGQEKIWLAAVKLEAENNRFDEARQLLQKAREKTATPAVWMKSAILERRLGNIDSTRQMLEQALAKFQNYPKLWLMRAQLAATEQKWSEARKFCQLGVRQCSYSIPLWTEYSRLEKFAGHFPKARAVLEAARRKIQKNPELWLASCRLEDNTTQKMALLAKGLQDCPDSGLLWSYAIDSEPMAKRKSKCFHAVKLCQENVWVLLSTAKYFWELRKISRAKDWFERAIRANPDIGDAWGYYYCFTKKHHAGELPLIIQRCVDNDPRHGYLWCQISKKVGNEGLKTAEILEQVAASISPP